MLGVLAQRRSALPRRAEDPVAEAKAAAEAAKLQLEAAKLRAEAESFEELQSAANFMKFHRFSIEFDSFFFMFT